MPLPTIEAIKTTIENNYATSIHDLQLAGYKPIPGLLGPMFYPGGFGVVFPMINSANHKYAFRVWHREIPGIRDRTNRIATFLHTANLPYFVEFDYVPNGLSVENDDGVQTVDTVRMDWVEGDNLHDFISNTKENESIENFKSIMRDLAANFKKMFKDLHQAGISHGDLQHGNVVIKDDLSIKLVDYDSVFVPTIRGEKQITSGLTGYQHPIRKTSCEDAAEYDDYFSELIIYSGLLMLSVFPDIWPDDEEEIDNFSFLFTENDFDSIINDTRGLGVISESNLNKVTSCNLFKKIANAHSSDPQEANVILELKKLLVLLVNDLNQTDLSQIKPLPGTAKSKKKDIYVQQDTTTESLDVDEIKQTLKELGAKNKRGYSYAGGAQVQVKVNKTDVDTRKDKYRNQ